MRILSIPVHYTLEIFPRCNNRCRGCGNTGFDKTGPFLPDLWRKILPRIQGGAAHVRLSGGEPTLHPKFPDIARYLAHHGIPFVLFTNGRWQNPDQLIGLLNANDAFRGMLISLHSHETKIHDNFSGFKGAFAETVRNIQKAVAKGVTVVASTILMPENVDWIPEMVRFFKTLGVCQTTFSRYVAVKNPALNLPPDRLRSAVATIEQLRENGSHVDYSVCIPQCFEASSSEGCLSGISYCIIDPWGNVRPCTHVPLICGNVLTDSIETIWHGPQMASWRRRIPEPCARCAEIATCRGGCRAIAYLNDAPADPLMAGPLRKSINKKRETMVLYEEMVPVNDFQILEESFGYALIRENHVLPVSFEAKPYIDLLGERKTLREFKETCGDGMINFIGALFRKGILEFEQVQKKH